MWKRDFRNIVLIGLSLVLHLAKYVISKRTYSHSVQDFHTLRTYAGVTIGKCEEECKNRKRCRNALYNRRQKFCTLISTHPNDQVVIANKEVILLTDFQRFLDADPLCGDVTCNDRDTCTLDIDDYVCKVTDCGQPPTFYDTEGNLYAVDDKIKSSFGSRTLTCGPDGTWTPEGSNAVFDCDDVTGPSGVYSLSTSHYNVYCDMETDGGKWLVFQRRQDGSENFLRGWTAYELGFGDLNGEFWLGLQLVHEILQSGQYELRVDLEDFSGNRRYAKYSTFSVSGYQDGYRLVVSGYTGTAGDSLAFHSSMMFSTYDRDNDFRPYNCAERYEGAWWFNACFKSNLNGKYFNGGQNTGSYSHHILWYHFRGFWYSLKKTELKFRRKDPFSAAG